MQLQASCGLMAQASLTGHCDEVLMSGAPVSRYEVNGRRCAHSYGLHRRSYPHAWTHRAGERAEVYRFCPSGDLDEREVRYRYQTGPYLDAGDGAWCWADE